MELELQPSSSMKSLAHFSIIVGCLAALGCTDDAGWSFKDDRQQTPAERRQLDLEPDRNGNQQPGTAPRSSPSQRPHPGEPGQASPDDSVDRGRPDVVPPHPEYPKLPRDIEDPAYFKDQGKNEKD